jgi:hypothetical protein
MNSDKNWVYIRTKEYATVSDRPLLTITYIPDQTKPRITNLNPKDNSIDISTTTNISLSFDEKIYSNI